jgi:hypothetical protein
MLDVAKDAVAEAARWLEQQDPSNPEADARFTLLRGESQKHYSQHVDALPKGTPYANVIWLGTRETYVRKNPTAAALVKMAQRYPIRDSAYKTYLRNKKNERHPKVIQAYRTQADVLAKLVMAQLRNLFADSR